MCNCGVICGCVGERLTGEILAFLKCRATGLDGGRNAVVVLGVGNHHNIGVVLRGGSNHRRPTNVDLLDDVSRGGVRVRDGRLERVEIADNKIDRGDSTLLQIVNVSLHRTVRQNRTMDRWMERLHPTTEHLGGTGDISNVDHHQTSVSEVSCSPARRHDFNT